VPLERAGEVTVLARGPGGLRIEGKSTEVSLAEEASALLFKVRLATIDTGIGLRNRHLREFLEVDKFPDATLRVRRADLEFPKEGSPVESQVTGELMLHGHSRPVLVR
jgi:polyisoprenoid-binding protein YceI